MTQEEQMLAMAIEYLSKHSRTQLRRVAAYLVGRGGEYYACGRFIEGALNVLDRDTPELRASGPKPETEPSETPLDFDKAYSSLTML